MMDMLLVGLVTANWALGLTLLLRTGMDRGAVLRVNPVAKVLRFPTPAVAARAA